MRILQVNDLLPGPGAGGAEVHLARLVDGLRAAGDEVDVFAGEVRHDGAAKVLDAWDPFAARALAARVRAFRPDVIHYHHVARELSAAVLRVGPGIPKVLTVQDFRIVGSSDHTGNPVLDRLQRVKSVLDRFVARRRVDLTVAVSEALERALTDAGFRRVVHLPNFADAPTGPPPPPPSASQDVVFAGRLTPDKGVHQLVEAHRSVVAPQHPDSRLVIAGDGPELEPLGRIATEAAADGVHIELLGRLGPDAVPDLFATARVAVVPSIPSLRPEGLPLVATEAALAGRPLVVGDDPGLRSFVERCRCGTVVSAADTDALGGAIAAFLADGARADEVGSTGRTEALASFTTGAVVAALREHYRDLVGGR